MTCANCPKEAAPRSALCWRCLKYRTRKGELPKTDPRTYGAWDSLMAAIEAWAAETSSADGDVRFDRNKSRRSAAEERIAKAAERFTDAKRRKRDRFPTLSNK